MSLERPTTYPDFAMKNCTDPISGQPNVAAIPQKLIDYGYAFRDKPEFNKFNYIFRSVAQWIRYVDQVTQSFGYLPFNFGKDASTTKGLVFGYLQGSVTQNNESITVPAGTVTLTANKTNIVYVDLTGTKVKVTTSPLPDDANDVELYDITTDSSKITNIVDKRTWINETASHQINWGNSSVAVKSQNGEVDINVAGSTVFKVTNSQVISNNPFKVQSGLIFADNTTQQSASFPLVQYNGKPLNAQSADANTIRKTGIYCATHTGMKNVPQYGYGWLTVLEYTDNNSVLQTWTTYAEGNSTGHSTWSRLIASDGKVGDWRRVDSPVVAKNYNDVTCGILVDELGDWNLVTNTGFFVCKNTSMKNGPSLESSKNHWWTCHVIRVPGSDDLTQTVTSLATDNTAPTFVRQYTAGAGWTSWQRIDYSMVANDARTINIANGDANHFTDFAGHYSATGDGFINTPKSLGFLSVYPYSDNQGCYQEFISFEDGTPSGYRKYSRVLARDGKTWSSWLQHNNTPAGIQSETLNRTQNSDGSLKLEIDLNQLHPVGALWFTFNESAIPPYQGKGITWKRVADMDSGHSGRLLAIAGSNNFAVSAGGKAGSTSTNNHTLTIDEIPPHKHSGGWKKIGGANAGPGADRGLAEDTGITGGGNPHSHGLDPARSGVIVWERTA